MKNFTRIMALVLVVLMLLPAIVACGGDGNDDPAATTTVNTAGGGGGGGGGGGEDGGETTTTFTPIAVQNWGGVDFRIQGSTSTATPQYDTKEIASETLNGDVVNDAVYTRNQAISAIYGINIVPDILVRESAQSTITTRLNSGDDNWDLLIERLPFMQQLAQAGQLYDLNTVNHLNFAAPCWNEDINSQLTMAGKLFYTTSDFLMLDKHRVYLNVYNRELARFYELGMLEDLVESGDWTIEKALDYSRTVSVEVDGIGGHSDNDAFGVVMDSSNALAAFAFGLGTRASKIGDDGSIILCGLDNNASDKWGKVIELTCDTNIARNCSFDQNWGIANEIFCDGRALISTCFLSSFDTTLSANMEFEHGFLPMPKWEKEQEAYHTVPDIVGSAAFAVPYTVTNADFVGYALEALSENSTNTSLAAYYETKCKLHLSFDQKCSDMLDLIFEGLSYDIVYNSNIGGMRSEVYAKMYDYGSNIWTRLYNKKVEAVELALEEIMLAYTGSAE
ncbi:MAG: hypothetical protein E7641_05620 [Ruminococcaceae bacterium]|nr:hypothetical protein [Oscillospiraceae bacterium]